MATEQRTYIRHPTRIAIRIFERDVAHSELHPLANVSIGGLCCHTDSAMSLGRPVRIEFPMLPEKPRLNGHVVWCRDQDDGYDVGVAFEDAQEAFRARMCEQICHIEDYRQAILNSEGRDLSSDEAAAEWIARHAADFP